MTLTRGIYAQNSHPSCHTHLIGWPLPETAQRTLWAFEVWVVFTEVFTFTSVVDSASCYFSCYWFLLLNTELTYEKEKMRVGWRERLSCSILFWSVECWFVKWDNFKHILCILFYISEINAGYNRWKWRCLLGKKEVGACIVYPGYFTQENIFHTC